MKMTAEAREIFIGLIQKITYRICVLKKEIFDIIYSKVDRNPMTNSWTPQQVLALAPDEGSRKNAIGLASPHKWNGINKSQEAGRLILWGEIKGSGADPYRCLANLDGPEFSCSCPSKKRPCKHALGLVLLFTSQPESFETGAMPDWVTAWLAKRAEADTRRAARAEGRGPASSPIQKERKSGGRSLGRDNKIRAGLDELEVWLCDLLRQGLAAAQNQANSFWETAAARLVDAQAPGLARLVREMPSLTVSGDGWQERMLEQIARLYLAVEGYRHIESLGEDTQADLRNLVGINIRQQELLKNPGVKDAWLVMGREIEEETNLKVQRTWLLGKESGRIALTLSFAAAGALLDTSLPPGTMIPGELVFYPGSLPLRAVVRERGPVEAMPGDLPGCTGFLEATQAYAAALSCYPWLERYPVLLKEALPFLEKGEWFCADRQGRRLPLAKQFLRGWSLLAISGGRAMGMFGEWDGERLLPLSAWADGQFYAFQPNLA
jgi:hypothetical protein